MKANEQCCEVEGMFLTIFKMKFRIFYSVLNLALLGVKGLKRRGVKETCNV